MSLDDDSGVKQAAMPQFNTPFVQKDERQPANGRLISIPWYRLLVAFWNRTGGSSGIIPGSVAPGTLQPFAGPVAPAGNLLCDGSLYPADSFPDLFLAIGYTWGGAGPMFAVPDFRNGRSPIGAGAGFPLGTSGGATSHVITQAELPAYPLLVTDPGHTHVQDAHNHTQASHNHTQNSHNHTQNSHNHTQNPHGHLFNTSPGTANTAPRPTQGSGGVQPTQGIVLDETAVNIATTATNIAATATNIATTATNIATTATNQDATTGITVSLNGGGQAIPTMGPWGAVNWIIKT